ncbi:hypothetical protein [Lacrimispora sp.]|uniref:hypothetical protein n=1 Tax=Lacrimispora sp. TaxID=2719234 RepID=UPI0029E6FDBD|nr:hypothetical protein [Lacrimispora sp.]
MNRHISLKSFLLEQMNRHNIAEDEQQNILRDIVALLIDNDWYGIEISVSNVGDETGLLFSNKDIAKMESNIQFFLKHYRKTIPEKVDILLKLLKVKYPLTSNELTSFYIEYDLDENEQYMINDFLLYTLEKDIHLYNNQEIDKLVQTVCEILPLYIGKQLIYFLSWIRKKHNTNFTLDFELACRRLNANKTNAYDSDTILQMVYYLFNPSYIQENNLFIHAARTPGVANCWIYLALHCISALRDTDIIRIPHPRLRQTPDEILQSIIDDTFDTKFATIAINSVLYQLKSRPIRPSKTASYSNISDIKLMIPESSMELFGMMFIISESHHQRKQSESVFITPVKDYEAIIRYLGEDIGNLFLENDFRARSANKAYMQAIELLSDTILDGETSDTQQPHAKGYMLAALARSHKGSYGEFCKTTEIYLKDAAFSGYSAEQIAQELLERGVCSFVVSMLLNIVTQGKYKKLNVSKQTQLIKEVGLSVWESDTFVTALDSSFESAKSIVSRILPTESQERRVNEILNILHNIGLGRAASKSTEFLCLMTAMNRQCPFKDTKQCIGCPYEITTKASVFTLVKEFQRLLALRDQAVSEHLKQKYTLLIKETVAPSLSEIFTIISAEYGDQALTEYIQMIKEILDEFTG